MSKHAKYIFVKHEDNKRKIYLNVEKIPLIATDNADTCDLEVAKNCDHNINNKYKREYKRKKEIVPYWMEHPEVCKSEQASAEEIAELEEMLKKSNISWSSATFMTNMNKYHFYGQDVYFLEGD